jgi:hypothetical protein
MNQKIISISIVTFLSLLPIGNANAVSKSEQNEKYADSTSLSDLKIRLNELKSINKSSLTFQERRELRQEVRQVNNHLKEPGAGGGIWISLLPVLVVIALIIILI